MTSERPASAGHSRILAGIGVAIVLGVAVGGWAPEAAVGLALLGEIFLNLLMMLVVPLVMLSMIMGITSLGDIRRIGSIGRRTILYYFVTTGISVAIGIVLVNAIRPGRGISPGEEHPRAAYRVEGPDGRTVRLTERQWDRMRYDSRYVLVLRDQNVQGAIASIEQDSVRVSLWERRNHGEPIYITAEDGTRVPFRRVEGQLVSQEPAVASEGVGVEITLPISEAVRGKQGGELGQVLREVLVGEPDGGKQGLIPRNIFVAMAELDVLPLIFFSLMLGAALSVLGPRAKGTLEVLDTLHDAVMQLVHWVMWITPLGIFGLIAARIGRAGGFEAFLPELVALGRYCVTVILGLLVHGVVVLSLILATFGRRRPIPYARGVAAALLNAFSTSSSSATLPLTLQGVREQNGISNRTASFVLPLGATINMDGTALYESVAALFIAQVYGIELSLGAQAIVFLTATLAAIGAAGIPEAGLVTMVIVLKAVGLPIEGIALLLTVDWMLDRMRTTVNVWGDSVGAAVIEQMEAKSS